MSDYGYASPLILAGPCNCSKPRPVMVRRPRKVYIDMNARPVFLKPSEQAEFTAEELVEYRKSWAQR